VTSKILSFSPGNTAFTPFIPCPICTIIIDADDHHLIKKGERRMGK
jgi:hypothetical protein